MLKLVFQFFEFLIKNRSHLKKLQAVSIDESFTIARKENGPLFVEKSVPKASVSSLEADIDEFWRTVPFHTLFLIYDLPIQNSMLGGTCTDRAILFYQRALEKYGPSLEIRLHRASIKDRETHTVLLVQLDQKTYLIDVGSNWPVMRLIPCFQGIYFESFGISFKSSVDQESLVIHMRKSSEDEFQPFLKAGLTYQSETYISEQVANRFSAENKLPFANSLRYSFVSGDSFYVIKHDAIIDKGPTNVTSYCQSMKGKA